MTPESSTETISMPPYQSIIKLESSCGDLQFEVGGIGAAVMVRCAAG